VGKSSLVNALLHEERMVVDAKPGTTVDAVDSEYETPAGRFTLVDTAGLRHEAKFAEDAEFYATLRTIRAVERANVVMVMTEAESGLNRQDVRVIAIAQEAHKPVALAYNKWDAVEDKSARWDELDTERAERFPTLARLPAIAISALDGTRLGRLPALWQALHEENTRRVPDGESSTTGSRRCRTRRRRRRRASAARAHLLHDAGHAGAAALRDLRQPARGHQQELPPLPAQPPARRVRLRGRHRSSGRPQEHMSALAPKSALALLAAFLLGAMPWGLWLGKLVRGVDVRQHGSGNLGATNVYRTLGPGLGWTVFLLDAARARPRCCWRARSPPTRSRARRRARDSRARLCACSATPSRRSRAGRGARDRPPPRARWSRSRRSAASSAS
jgi:small GTP-binding protein